VTFIDELLQEAEVKEKQQIEEMNKLRADQILSALTVLEQQAEDVNKLADDEISIIEEYRQSELGKIGKKTSWLAWQLEQFIKSANEKTMNLPHGTLKLRLGRDKVEITDIEKFIPFAQKKGLLREIPESYEPDLSKIHEYIKFSKVAPAGVTLIPAQNKFSYTTKKGNTNGKELQAEA
jgi:phage host-nuclease inhibitor protein Gam